jgi:DNA-binding MarR family transcriptional regulator
MREALTERMRKRGVIVSTAALPIVGMLVMKQGAKLNQSEVVSEIGIDRHRVSRLVKELVTAGYVQTSPNLKNRRENVLSFTEAGEEAASIIAGCASQVIELAYTGCSNEERQITEQTIKKIITNLNQSDL